MAAPVTHIVFADAFLKTAPHFSRSEFIIGTSFPDIRHLGSLTREQTHSAPVSISSVLEESDSFIAGMKFHNYIDHMRSSYWKQASISTSLPESSHLQQVLKLHEDIRLYGRSSDWSLIAAYFQSATIDSSALGITDEELHRWHRMLVCYISHPPLAASLAFKDGFKNQPDLQTVSKMTELFYQLEHTHGLSREIDRLYSTLTHGFVRTVATARQPLLNLVE